MLAISFLRFINIATGSALIAVWRVSTAGSLIAWQWKKIEGQILRIYVKNYDIKV